MSEQIDYPVDTPAGVDPVIFRAQIIQNMALRYFNWMRGAPEEFTMAEAHQAAMATWETDWPDDPKPRTLEDAIQAVDDDLAYWGEG